MKKFTTTICAVFLVLFVQLQLVAQTVNIDLNNNHQSVDGVGFCHEGDRQNGDYYIIDSNIQQMIDNHMSLFRDMFPNKTFDMNNTSSQDVRVTNCMQRLKQMQDRGIITILGIWDVPNWLAGTSPNGKRNVNNINSFADFITAFLVYGKNHYGLSVPYVDVNETKYPYVANLDLSTTEYSNLVTACASRFAANGLTTKINLGSDLLGDGLGYDQTIYNNVHTSAAAGFPSTHSYRSGNLTGNQRDGMTQWTNWGNWQKTIDRSVWCTETDYDAFYYSPNNSDLYNWTGCEEMAYMYWRNYYIARFSTSAGWYWHTNYFSNAVHRAYMNYFEPGGQIVEASQPTGTEGYDQILTLAYKHVAKQKFVMQVLNESSYDRTVTFTGLPADQSLTLVRTSEAGENLATIGTYSHAGSTWTTTIKANSLSTFYGALAPAVCNTVNVPGTVQGESYCTGSGISSETCTDTGGGLNLSSVETNDWAGYRISVPAAGSYKVTYRVAALNAGGIIRLEKQGGSPVFGTISVPQTSGWQTWTTISHNVTLPAGVIDIAIVGQVGGFNVNWFSIAANTTDTQSPTAPVNLRSTAITQTTVALAWDASTDNVGVAGYQIFNSSNVLIGSSTGTSTTLQNLSPNTSYTFTAKAYDAAGNFSGASNSVTVTTDPVAASIATVYADCNFTGLAVNLSVGSYTMAQLQALGAANDNISSLKVQSGYRVTLYADNNFAGTSLNVTADDACLVDNSFNDLTTSLIVSAVSSSIVIQAENYNNMSGVTKETCTDTGGGQNLGSMDLNDWVVYDNVNIPSSGSYTVQYRVASLNGGAKFQLEKGGGSVIYGTVTLPSTGGWQTWTTVQHTVNLTAGVQSFGIKVTASGGNLNWFSITPNGARASLLAPEVSESKISGAYPSPASHVLNINTGIDSGASLIEIHSLQGALLYKGKIDGPSGTIDVSELNYSGTAIIRISNKERNSAIKILIK